jgi:hypothetical protein
VADEVPVDVVQKVLGHASLQTTSIYVQAEKKRVLEEVRRLLCTTCRHCDRREARQLIAWQRTIKGQW